MLGARHRLHRAAASHAPWGLGGGGEGRGGEGSGRGWECNPHLLSGHTSPFFPPLLKPRGGGCLETGVGGVGGWRGEAVAEGGIFRAQ